MSRRNRALPHLLMMECLHVIAQFFFLNVSSVIVEILFRFLMLPAKGGQHSTFMASQNPADAKKYEFQVLPIARQWQGIGGTFAGLRCCSGGPKTQVSRPANRPPMAGDWRDVHRPQQLERWPENTIFPTRQSPANGGGLAVHLPVSTAAAEVQKHKFPDPPIARQWRGIGGSFAGLRCRSGGPKIRVFGPANRPPMAGDWRDVHWPP